MLTEALEKEDDKVFEDAVRPGSPKAAWDAYVKRVQKRKKNPNKRFGQGRLPGKIIGGVDRDYNE